LSSHREAPEISKDPVADNTDVYAFVSPDRSDTVTIIANFIPFQIPDGGPNFAEFGDDVLYQIHIANSGKGVADITYEFKFTTHVADPDTFLYNTGPITGLDSSKWNRRQTYTVTRFQNGQKPKVLGKNLQSPPVNVGARSTPNYPALAKAAIHSIPLGGKVFAGQRAEGFFADLGSIFDLGTLRPFEAAHLIPSAAAVGVNGTQELNVHSIAIQIPIKQLTKGGVTPKNVAASNSVIGVWASTRRQLSRLFNTQTGTHVGSGPYVQVSRLGMPLINEVIIPMGEKDRWNAGYPHQDSRFIKYYDHPELSSLLPVLYPGVFPHLAKLKGNRADLVAVLLTGLPNGIVKGFQNYTGKVQSDMLRLNVAVPPTAPASANAGGLLSGDAAGFPNGRRVFDDVVAVELRALAGLTYPLVDKTYTTDAASGAITDGTTNSNGAYLSTFPYLALPNSGTAYRPGTPAAA
jgi:hypothetical protein